MKLFEIFGDPLYTVKRTDGGAFEVAKFSDHNEPDAVYHVELKKSGQFWTDSPGFIHKEQTEKHILLVKQFIADKEPELTAYKFEANGQLTKHKFG